ncbi:MAG: sigma-70 family RNA polymerase sigma factor [Clostridia bacterium]|nr:sigma-70 family RNA polymerase sigma factor [Clostridia bacterium]
MENHCLITLVEKFRMKDMSAFPLIFAEFEGLLHHYAAKCQAEDTFQELSVFLVELLYKMDLKKFRKDSTDSLKRYIAVSIGNRYIAFSKEDNLFKRDREILENSAFSNDIYLQRQILADALRTLTKKQRMVILCRYIYDYSDVEIADSLGISRQAVNRIKNRAMESMREYLK